MNRAKIHEFLVDQGNHNPQANVEIGTKVLKVTVKAHPLSGSNVYVGINQKASDINLLTAGDSVTYHDDRVYLDDTKLYIGFDPTGTGGIALVSIISETEIPVC